MPEGFQTQLSETANKQRREGAPLLEAFLDANGRMAFRFVGEGGVPIAQPKVTTSGFVPQSLGITPQASETPASTITPQASQVLTGFDSSRGDQGGEGLTATQTLDQPGFAASVGPLTGLDRKISQAVSFLPGVGIGSSIARALRGIGLTSVGPDPASPLTLREAMVDERRLSSSDEFSDPNPTFDFTLGDRTELTVSTTESINALDSMSSLGSSGGVFAEAGQGGFGEVGREGGDRDRAGTDADFGGDRVGGAGASFGGESGGPF